jgi:peptidoglycan/LPS O-acetylase OafA/YrhL
MSRKQDRRVSGEDGAQLSEPPGRAREHRPQHDSGGPGITHFPGLNSLRFYAAFCVLIGHIPLNQESRRLPAPHYGAIFFRGAPAVSFFFTLSGFLITWLLLREVRTTGGVDVRSFYLRRICRIWPLYFLIVFFGLAFYNLLLPRIGMAYPVEYSIPFALLLYVCLLPNLMNSLYTVGGILNPLWSIGVEEQFYLAWAPAVKRFHRVLPWVCGGILLLSFTNFCLSSLGVYGQTEMRKFTGQLQIHFMAAGALAAWALSRHRERFLALPVFASRLLQIVLALLLLDFYLTTFLHWGWFGTEIVQVVLYTWLIVNVAANPRNVLRVENRVTDYLGTISYGIYMFHMIAVYTTSFVFLRWRGWEGKPLALYVVGYYGLAIGLAILLASASYRWFETPFLRLKDRRYTKVPSEPATPHPNPSPTPSLPPGEGQNLLRSDLASPLSRQDGRGWERGRG